MTSAPDEPLIVTAERDGAIVVIGEVDVATSGALSARLRQSVEQADGDLVVDLSGVAFMDSSGLRVLLETYEACGARQLRLVLRDPSPTVQRLLELTGLSDRL